MALIQEAIVAEANRQGVNAGLALRVAQAESSLNPNARGTQGEIGVFQLMPGTAGELGVNPFDVMDNIRGGIAYLGQQFSRFSNVAAALAAYNWGPDNVARTLAVYGGQWAAHIPASTRAYVSRILGGWPSVQAGSVSVPTGVSVKPIQRAATIPLGAGRKTPLRPAPVAAPYRMVQGAALPLVLGAGLLVWWALG